MIAKILATVVLVSGVLTAQTPGAAPLVLPSTASIQLLESLKLASSHRTHTWRDTAPFTGALINGYIEIPMGELTKHEFDMESNARKVDRVMSEGLGGYPVNYGYVPQTVSYDGDPFDVLVLGPALPGGELVQGLIVGLMLMEDEKGLDSKVVISPVDADGKAKYALTPEDQARIGDYFNTYKAKGRRPEDVVEGSRLGNSGRRLVVRPDDGRFLPAMPGAHRSPVLGRAVEGVYPSAARSSAAMSSFFIFSMAPNIALPPSAGSGPSSTPSASSARSATTRRTCP